MADKESEMECVEFEIQHLAEQNLARAFVDHTKDSRAFVDDD